ncbi:MAG TPA: DMT family transporter [Symbiobacteriaceae bacterium]|nr:DMT family transporter [Symbiobacteriaceae bacterium]
MPRWVAVVAALFVTFLWSTSYILNKWAFAEGIQPFTLAGLRYLVAACTLAMVRRPGGARTALPWWQYAALGVAGYLVAQGFQYVGQYHVTPTQSGLILNVGNTLLVLAVGLIWLGERPGARQWLGLVISLGGVCLFYWPLQLEAGNLLGIGMLLLSGAGYAAQLTANRALLSRKAADPLSLVLYPMATGAAGMIALAILLEPWPAFSWKLAAILLWLGVVNGALAFFLWTWSQKALQAFESSVLNNTMLLQVVTLDVLLLGRQVGVKQAAGLMLAGLGILAVQAAARRGAR